MAAERKAKRQGSQSLESELIRLPRLQKGYPTKDPRTGKVTVRTATDNPIKLRGPGLSHLNPLKKKAKKKAKASKAGTKPSTAIDRADQEKRSGINRGGSRMRRSKQTENYTPKGKKKR